MSLEFRHKYTILEFLEFSTESGSDSEERDALMRVERKERGLRERAAITAVEGDEGKGLEPRDADLGQHGHQDVVGARDEVVSRSHCALHDLEADASAVGEPEALEEGGVGL